MAINPATDAVQQNMPSGLAQYLPCTSAPNICWLGFYADDQYLTGAGNFTCPQLTHIGGNATAYPVTMTYRVNGQVIQTSTGADAAHFPQPPASCHASAPPGGWVVGDIAAVSATLSDARGVTLTAATWLGFASDDGGDAQSAASGGRTGRSAATGVGGVGGGPSAAAIMARQAELRARAGIHLNPWEIRQDWQHKP